MNEMKIWMNKLFFYNWQEQNNLVSKPAKDYTPKITKPHQIISSIDCGFIIITTYHCKIDAS